MKFVYPLVVSRNHCDFVSLSDFVTRILRRYRVCTEPAERDRWRLRLLLACEHEQGKWTVHPGPGQLVIVADVHDGNLGSERSRQSGADYAASFFTPTPNPHR